MVDDADSSTTDEGDDVAHEPAHRRQVDDVDPDSADEADDVEDAEKSAHEPAHRRLDDEDSEPAGRSRTAFALTLAGWSVLGLVGLGLAWVVVTGLLARSHLEDAREQLKQLRVAVTSGDIDRASRIERQLRDDTGSAHALTEGPAWWVASSLPVVGTPLETARVITAQASHLGADVVPGVFRLVRTLDATARKPLSSFDLTAVERAAPQLAASARSARAAYRQVADTDGSWFGPVTSGRQALLSSLSRLVGELDGAAEASKILPPMMGSDTPQRYFIGFLNEAEARGGGGIPGAFAIATVDHGRVTFEHFGSEVELIGVRATGVNLGPQLRARFAGNDPLGTIQNSNLSPNFAIAGEIWAGKWTAKTGKRVDGAIAIDPTALGYLLKVTGPAQVGSTRVSAHNVVALTQRDQYEDFPGLDSTANANRKRYLTTLAGGISKQLIGGSHGLGLAKALSRAAAERRLTVWHRTPSIERELQEVKWAGTLGNTTPRPFAGFIVNNAAGSKLDYYLDRRMTYRRTDCRAGGKATATFTMTNTAPRTGLPTYVTFRADTPPAGARPGDNRLLVTYYADLSATITSMTVNGAPVSFIGQPEGNTVSATTTVEIKAQSSVTVQVTVSEPKAEGPLTLLRQPLVRPLTIDDRGNKCR